ncbi:heme-binding protein [Lentibacter algarum]|uniref:GlcG/HbpS family heme-binding protein n=1 Tax=Lentibacter algarum TaxID=576131 RepID=UPI001C088D59|nr:heme-binding protein [Lentibacter algarum]MBU2983710.1 heme-binding protein [Lentibacter algarum]
MAADTAQLTTLSFMGAQKVLSAAIQHAQEIGVPMCIAIVDVRAVPILTARMDEAPFGAVPICLNKARTVVGFNGFATAEWWPSIQDDPAMVHGITHTPGLVIFGGGVGLFKGDILLGAIGVSGGESSEDETVAAIGASALP